MLNYVKSLFFPVFRSSPTSFPRPSHHPNIFAVRFTGPSTWPMTAVDLPTAEPGDFVVGIVAIVEGIRDGPPQAVEKDW
eukprot:s1357_g1.t1